MRVNDAVFEGATAIAHASTEPRRDAGFLLCHTLSRGRAWLLAHPDHELAEAQRQRFAALLARRAQHEPMQYILGEQEFWGLMLRVTPDVLIPRPETEHLIEAALSRLPPDRALCIADVGTGSGAIAVALAHSLPLATIHALDISEPALAVARENAARHGLLERIHFHRSDLLHALAGQRFDAIAANLPYVAEGEQLPEEVRRYEPHTALFAGPDGMDIYRRLLRSAAEALRPGGVLLLEFGYEQKALIEALFGLDARWDGVEFLPDLQGIPRVAITSRCQPER